MKISPNVRANTAMKYITNLGVDDTIAQNIQKAAENHDSVKKVFDLIDELYAKCRKEARAEFSSKEKTNLIDTKITKCKNWNDFFKLISQMKIFTFYKTSSSIFFVFCLYYLLNVSQKYQQMRLHMEADGYV